MTIDQERAAVVAYGLRREKVLRHLSNDLSVDLKVPVEELRGVLLESEFWLDLPRTWEGRVAMGSGEDIGGPGLSMSDCGDGPMERSGPVERAYAHDESKRVMSDAVALAGVIKERDAAKGALLEVRCALDRAALERDHLQAANGRLADRCDEHLEALKKITGERYGALSAARLWENKFYEAKGRVVRLVRALRFVHDRLEQTPICHPDRSSAILLGIYKDLVVITAESAKWGE